MNIARVVLATCMLNKFVPFPVAVTHPVVQDVVSSLLPCFWDGCALFHLPMEGRHVSGSPTAAHPYKSYSQLLRQGLHVTSCSYMDCLCLHLQEHCKSQKNGRTLDENDNVPVGLQATEGLVFVKTKGQFAVKLLTGLLSLVLMQK